ncbi:putative ankyrin repeat-containing protein [Eutypa lata UCREL1]|uniref:Putative ankyrin repeat-containing protein n=1 Tax=Eutypa lata (strain UCR-EL1) TaxID=1287681 RepID=M7TPQ0_EUTLA|nr:putative ankyrin repeat-containing protein [Eutypa lata UCREL1]
MADPTSIVGLAAGLVSLGIQVCGGITAYLDAVKCRADDITSVNRQAQNFGNVLRIIQTALARVDPSHQVSTTVVDECLKSCESEVKGLKDFVSGLVGSDISQPKFMDKIKEKTRKLTYVFDRPKLEQLEGRLSRVNGIFQTALQALDL